VNPGPEASVDVSDRAKEIPMKMYRCRICGETHLGYEKPSNCPFCGAHADLIVLAPEYPTDINAIELTETERADVLESIELERSNTRFYLAMAANRDNDMLASAYKRLARIESEHCSLFCKLARVPKPADLTQPSEASDDWCKNIDESLVRERRASDFYAQVMSRATSERIREVFGAVSGIEADHIDLDGLAKEYAGCE
jgi:rubrerythrin